MAINTTTPYVGNFVDGIESLLVNLLYPLTDAHKIAALSDAHTMTNLDQFWADIDADEVVGGSLAAGGIAVTNLDFIFSGADIGQLTMDDVTISNLPDGVQYLVLYNTVTDRIAGWINFGQEESLVANLGISFTPTDTGPSVVTADTAANPRVKNFKSQVDDLSGSGFMAGQHLGTAGTISLARTHLVNYRASTGGKNPLICHFDVATGGLNNFEAFADFIADEIWPNSFPMFSMHAPNPATNGSYNDESVIVNFTNLTDPAHALHDNFYDTYFSKYVDFFELLEDRGVIAGFRPGHEHNTSTDMWWSQRQNNTITAANWADWWIEMFDYVHTTRGLHNLLWCFSGHEYDPNAYGFDSLYPGDPYVDWIGGSVYINPGFFSSKITNIQAWRTAIPGKTPWTFEMGPSGSTSVLDLTTDYRTLLKTTGSSGASEFVGGSFWNNGSSTTGNKLFYNQTDTLDWATDSWFKFAGAFGSLAV